METLVMKEYDFDFPQLPSPRSKQDCHWSSFGWGDMPYQGDNHLKMDSMNNSCYSISLPESFFLRHTPTKWWWNSTFRTNSHTLTTSIDANAQTTINATATTTTAFRKRRLVRFAEQVQVRTHETILGDHPSCRDGLALQCGWAYTETEYLPLHPPSCRNIYQKHSSNIATKSLRMNQIKRRERLREVTGMSNVQLLQLANEMMDVSCWRLFLVCFNNENI